jgi:hypothetical protein
MRRPAGSSPRSPKSSVGRGLARDRREVGEAGTGGHTSSSPPPVTHGIREDECLRCKAGGVVRPSLWCTTCIELGKEQARTSIARQIAAGMPVPSRNWQLGDPHWWKASGCYGPQDEKGK